MSFSQQAATPVYPPSGITRNYGVDFFIYMLPDSGPGKMAATTSPQAPSVPWQFIVTPSVGLQQYFDSILGGAPLVTANWDDCISDAFVGDSNGSGGSIMMPA